MSAMASCRRPWWKGVSLAVLAGGLVVAHSGKAEAADFIWAANPPDALDTGFDFTSGNNWGVDPATTLSGESNTFTVDSGTSSLQQILNSPGFTVGSIAVTVPRTVSIVTTGTTPGDTGSLVFDNTTAATSAKLDATTGASLTVGVDVSLTTSLDVNSGVGNGGTVVLSGAVSGSGQSVTVSAGNVRLENANNSYDGGTHVNGGSLTASANGALGRGAVIVAGGTLNLGGASHVLESSLAVAGGATVSDGTVSATAFDFQSGVVSAALTGSGAVSKTTSGTVVLSGANDFTGGTSIAAGTVVVGNVSGLGTGGVTLSGGSLELKTDSSVSANAVTVSADSALIVNRATVGAAASHTLGNLTVDSGTLTISVGGNVTGTAAVHGTADLTFDGVALNAPSTFAVQNGSNVDTTVTFGGVVTGSGELLKTGEGSLVLNGANSHSGGTDISAGKVVVGDVSGLGTGLVTLSGGNLELKTDTTVNANAVTVSADSTMIVNIATPGSAASHSLGDLTVDSGTLAVSAGSNVTGTPAAHGTADLAFVNVALNAPSTFAVQNGTNVDTSVTLRGAVSGTGQLRKTGTGTLVLNADNNYSGGTEISAGVVRVGASTTTALGSGDLSLTGGTLDLAGSTQDAGTANVALNAGVLKSTVSTGTVTTGGNFTSTVAANNTMTVEDSVVLSGTAGLLKNGAGTLALLGTNTYSGGTVLSEGVLEIGSSASLGTGSLTLSGGTLHSRVAMLLDGVISGNSAVVVSAPGLTVDVINSSNSYTGGTTVTAGTLDLGAAGSLGTGPVILDGVLKATGNATGVTLVANQTLSGNGEVQAAVNLNGGTISPGHSPGTLHVVALTGPGTYNWERGDHVVTTGTGSDLSTITFSSNTVTGASLVQEQALQGTRPLTYPGVINGTGLAAAGLPVLGIAAPNSAVITITLVNPTGASVDLVVDRSSYASFQRTRNGAAFGTYLDAQLSSKYTAQDALGSYLRGLDSLTTASEVSALLNSANPGTAYASLYSTSVRSALAVGSSLDEHLDALAANGSPEAVFNLGVSPVRTPGMLTPHQEADMQWTAWTAAYATDATFDADASAGFGRTRSNDAGATLGVERAFGNLKVGVLASFGQGDATFEDPSVQVSSDHWTGGAYGNVAIGAITVDASALWTNSDDTSKRTAASGRAQADFTSNTTQLGVGVAVNLLPQTSGWQLTPVARLKYVDYSQDAFEESGSGLLFRSGKVSESTVLSKLGLRVAKRGELSRSVGLGIDGAAYWVHDFDASSRAASLQVLGGNSAFQALGRKGDADSAQLNLGVQATFSEAWTVRLSGQQEIGNNRSQSAGVFSVALNF